MVPDHRCHLDHAPLLTRGRDTISLRLSIMPPLLIGGKDSLHPSTMPLLIRGKNDHHPSTMHPPVDWRQR